MPHQIRHGRLVVPDSAAHIDANELTLTERRQLGRRVAAAAATAASDVDAGYDAGPHHRPQQEQRC